MLAPLPRRTLTLTTLFLTLPTLWLASPALALIAGISDLVRGTSALRALAFIMALVTLEACGILGFCLVRIRCALSRQSPLLGLFHLQEWWAIRVQRSLVRAFSLRLDVQTELPETGPLIVLPRHVSMADSIVPISQVTSPMGLLPRYVLKEELKMAPCMDVVGSALPNAFVRRYTGSPKQISKVTRLTEDMHEKTAVVLFPEGTRFEKKVRDKLISRPKTADRARHFKRVLPPRGGGVLALLSTCDADVLLVAHVGLEGVTRMHDLVNGSLVGNTIYVRTRLIRRTDIPTDSAAQRVWLDTAWEWVDHTIDDIYAEMA